MKRYLFCFFLFIGALVKAIEPIPLFITKDNLPTPELVELLALDGLYDPNDRLPEIVQKTQAKWIGVLQGKDNKERIDLIDSPERLAIKEKVIEVVRKMGLFNAASPSLSHYDYGICLGSYLSGVRSHLADLVHYWEKGVRFNSLYFLTGERPLRKGRGEPDDFAALCDPKKSPLPFKVDWRAPDFSTICYENEYDMVKLVWEQVQLPEEMAKALDGKVFFVNASKGNAGRASTAGTYQAWLKEFNPDEGSLVAPSYPMLYIYQQLIAIRVLGEHFDVDSTADAVTDQVLKHYEAGLVSIIFDTVAKCLYEISLIKGEKAACSP